VSSRLQLMSLLAGNGFSGVAGGNGLSGKNAEI
jgi:hypothetical protein